MIEISKHITAASGNDNIPLVEINKGPYLVKPVEEAYDKGECPINMDVSSIVWLTNEKTNYIDPKSTAELSFLLDSKKNA